MGKNENQGSENHDKKQNDRLLTVKEVANLINETPNVVRNWLKDLKMYIPLQKNESGYNVFGEEAIERLKLIKHLHRERNYSVKQIEHYLATDGEAYKLVPEKKAEEILAEEMKELKEQIKQLQEHSKKQEEFNKALIEKLDNQGNYIDEKLNKRDQLLLQSVKETLEAKQQIASSKEVEKKGFWARLFSK